MLWLLLLALPFRMFAQTEEDIKEKADELFKKEAYVEATPFYLRLLSLQPRDYNYNYRYGTCLLFNADRKQDAFKYLNYASKGSDVEKEVFYFLGKAYHLSFQFDKAITYYKKYQEVAGVNVLQKLNVARQIEMCKNAKFLMNSLSKLVVLNKQQIAQTDFFRLYQLQNIGGTLLVTQDFQSKEDKKNQHVPLIHFPDNPSVIFYSSYGDNPKNGLDIYMRKKLPNGSWSMPQTIKGDVNTSEDEDYPFMQAGGEYLYFSSKGHNSMGGYDVFRAHYNPLSESFEEVENLNFAISSPGDDLFYIVDSLNHNAYFASARESQAGKINVYQVRVERFPNQLVVFKGNFVSEIHPEQKTISVEVFDLSSGQKIGSYHSSAKDGSYLITVPKGGDYKYVVQYEGETETHTATMQAPFLNELKALKQKIIAYNLQGKESIRIVNEGEVPLEDQESIIAEVLTQQSKLEPNSSEFNIDSLNKISDQKELLAKIGIEKYGVQELSSIASHDVLAIQERITTKQGDIDKLNNVIAESIASANESAKKSEALMIEAENSTDPAEVQSKINEAILQKENALNMAQKAKIADELKQNTEKEISQETSNLAKAKEVETLFKSVNEQNLSSTIAATDAATKNYLAKNFNKTAKSGIENDDLSIADIKKRDEINQEINRLNDAINERNERIAQLEKQKSDANKKELAAIENQIENLNNENATDKELLALKEKERAIIADRAVESQVKQNILAEINSEVSPPENAIETSPETLENILAENTNTSLTELQQKGETILAQKGQENDSQHTKENQNVVINSTDTSHTEEIQPSDNELLSTISPELVQQEQNIASSSNSSEQKQEEQKQLDKKWIDVISKHIAAKEKELKQHPADTKLQHELAQLNDIREVKTNELAQLEQASSIHSDTTENQIDNSNIDSTAPMTLENMLATLSPDYTTKINELSQHESSKETIQQENNLANELLQKIATREKALKKDNSPNALREKELLTQLKESTQKAIDTRNSELSNLANKGQDTLFTSAPTKSDLVANYDQKLADIKANPDAKQAQKDELNLEKDLLKSIEKKEKELQAKSKANPDDVALSNASNELAQLKQATESHIASLEDNETPSNENPISENISSINELRTDIVGKDAMQLFSATPTTEKEKGEQMHVLNDYLEKLKTKQAEHPSDTLLARLVQEDSAATEKRLVELQSLVFSDAPTNENIASQPNEIKALEEKQANLIAQLNTASGKERQSIQKEISALEEQKTDLQAARLKDEQDSLSNTINKTSEAGKALQTPSIELGQLQLQEQLDKTKTAIAAIKGANNKTAQVNKALDEEKNLNELAEQQQATIQLEQLKSKLAQENQLDKNTLTPVEQLQYENKQIEQKISDLEQSIASLENKKSKASKKYRPSIEIDLSNMRSEVLALKKMQAENEQRIQAISAKETTPVTLLSENSSYPLPDSSEMKRIAQKDGYAELSNEIRELQVMEQRQDKLKLDIATQEEVLNQSLQAYAHTTDAVEKGQTEQNAAKAVQAVQAKKDELHYLQSKINELDTKIKANPLMGEDKEPILAMATRGVQGIAQPIVTSEFQTGLQFNATQNSNAIPIPIDAEFPKGLVFKVQIGAFTSPVNAEAFREFSPVVGEKRSNSKYIRYLAGNFADKASAYQAQGKIRTLGYSDAFVVAYCDGERVPLYQVEELIASGKCAPSPTLLAAQETNNSTNLASTNTAVSVQQTMSSSQIEQLSSYNKAPNASPATAVEVVRGLFYTVQIGVYNSPVPSSRLFNVTPVFSQLTEKSQIRYSTGKFDDVAAAVIRKNEIRQIGISDAFVTAYYNGKRITVAEANKLLQTQGRSILSSELENNQPPAAVSSSRNGNFIVSEQTNEKIPLNENKISFVIASNETYESAPQSTLNLLNTGKIWYYYNITHKRIESLPIEKNTTFPEGMKWVSSYQGFDIDSTQGNYLNGLRGFDFSKTYYQVTITWEADVPLLLANWLKANTYTLKSIDLEHHSITLEGLEYEVKEQIIAVLQRIPEIRTNSKSMLWN